MAENKLKHFFIKLIVIALVISAAVGVFIFLVGNLYDLTFRVLATTLLIGVFSIVSLCYALISFYKRYRWFSFLAVFVALVGLIVILIDVWSSQHYQYLWMHEVSLLILSLAMAHISLLLYIQWQAKKVKQILIGTIVSVAAVSLMLVVETYSNYNAGEIYYRALGVFSILAVLGTVLIVVFNKISTKKELEQKEEDLFATKDMDERILSFIKKQTAASIFSAVTIEEPYSFSCFYVFDERDKLLYFKSSTATQHAQFLKQNPKVSGTIVPDVLNKKAIQGIQFKAELLPQEHSLAANADKEYHAAIPMADQLEGKVYTLRLDSVKMTDSVEGKFEKYYWER